MTTRGHLTSVAADTPLESGIVGHAQRILMDTLGISRTDALRELSSHAATDEVSLRRAASRIVARRRLR